MYGSKSNSTNINNPGRKSKNHFQQNFTQSSANFSQSNFNGSPANNGNDMSNNNAQGQAVQLLGIKANGQVQVNNQALDIIASYNDKPVGFVALVGKYRTGKSFLLNKLLFLQNNGFKVQQYTNACTQGIWMWTNPFLNQYLGNYLFFVDTEGLASMQKGQQNDIRIFTLTTLLSSYLIYNSVGNIDQRSISDLNAVSKLSKNIMTQDSLSIQENEQRLQDFMPKFCWVIRDFTLQLQDERGRKITPKQYLQNSLKQDNTHVRINDDARRIKRSLLTHFKDRDCITLVRPARQQNQIQSLNRLPDVSLRRQFIQGVNGLRQKIQRNAGCKKFQGKDLFGNDMACMIQAYAMAINQGKIPSIKSAWEQIADNQGDIAYSMAHQKYLQLFEDHFGNQEAKEEKQLYKLLSSMKEEAIQQFRRNSSSDQQQEYYKKLRDWIKKQEQAIIQANSNAMGSKNLQILKQESHDLMRKVESNHYVGKKEEYLSDLEKVLRNYRRRAVGDGKQALLSQFLQTTNKISVNLDREPQNYENNQYLAREAQQMMKVKQMQNESRQKQAVVTANIAKKETTDKQKRADLKKKNKTKEQKVGCCGGKKCQIM